MSISPMAMKAYNSALEIGNEFKPQKNEKVYDDFSETIKGSLQKVNDMNSEKKQMIQSFASGEN
ncbi:MAG: flagellar hook-basal body complex protein FliE, partial [Desulfonatronovibrio sp.]